MNLRLNFNSCFNQVTLLIATTVFLLSPVSSSLASAEYRIATVDINRVLNESSTAKVERKKLDDRAASARKKLEERGKALRTRKDALEKAEGRADQKEIDKFRAEARDFEREVKDIDEDLKKEFVKINRHLAERTVALVADYAKKNKIDLVLDKGEESRGPVLFGQPSFDVTKEIIAEMNKAKL